MVAKKEFVLESNPMFLENHVLAWKQIQFYIILIQDSNTRI